MKKLVLTLTFAVCFLAFVDAQDYNTGIGLRGGLYNGLTVKHFLGSKAAVEGILASRWRGLEITGLYEMHNRLADVDRLNWYYGIGGHIGFYNSDYTTWGDINTDYTVIGIDLILGLEYNFSAVPINISIDWKPAFNLVGYSRFWGDGGALSVRYIF
jgi:hypothetical protein